MGPVRAERLKDIENIMKTFNIEKFEMFKNSEPSWSSEADHYAPDICNAFVSEGWGG